MIKMKDDRSISQIAQDFEGLEEIDRKSETEGDGEYVGYSELTSVSREKRDGTVLLILEKPKEG